MGAKSHNKRGEPEASVQDWERQCPAAVWAGWKGQSNAGQMLSRAGFGHCLSCPLGLRVYLPP